MIELTPPGLIAGFICLLFMAGICLIPAVEITLTQLLGALKHLFWGDKE